MIYNKNQSFEYGQIVKILVLSADNIFALVIPFKCDFAFGNFPFPVHDILRVERKLPLVAILVSPIIVHFH